MPINQIFCLVLLRILSNLGLPQLRQAILIGLLGIRQQNLNGLQQNAPATAADKRAMHSRAQPICQSNLPWQNSRIILRFVS